ncbi:MAG: hypothetical protein N2117_06775 [Anaerolineales bacterium]|nr:hypothetical protein [Anaerolineales bacterium]MCX7754936.1 hypothetical protein [Anaerolineales bacterium]MDW8277313.1 hypothetical protein [Anaerolineales bacterium]
MANLEARIRMAAESILDNEALRSGLNDEESARILLDWGISWAKTLTRQTADIEDDDEADEAVYPRMKALRSLMVALKDLAIAENWPSDDLRQSLETALEHAQVLFGANWQPPADFKTQVAVILQSHDARTRLDALLKLLEKETQTSQPATVQEKKPEGFFARWFRKWRGD